MSSDLTHVMILVRFLSSFSENPTYMDENFHFRHAWSGLAMAQMTKLSTVGSEAHLQTPNFSNSLWRLARYIARIILFCAGKAPAL